MLVAITPVTGVTELVDGSDWHPTDLPALLPDGRACPHHLAKAPVFTQAARSKAYLESILINYARRGRFAPSTRSVDLVCGQHLRCYAMAMV